VFFFLLSQQFFLGRTTAADRSINHSNIKSNFVSSLAAWNGLVCLKWFAKARTGRGVSC
jgi:hypothetical protein